MNCKRTLRHFTALCRKNWIIWKRNFVCTIFQMVVPVVLMLVLIYARSVVKIKHTDLVALEKYRHPAFPALVYKKATHGDSYSYEMDAHATNDAVQDFMMWANYHPKSPLPTPWPNSNENESVDDESVIHSSS